MVPTLNIDKFTAGLYRATVEEGGQPLTDEMMFPRIADAIAHFGTDIPDNLAAFVEVRYAGLCIGTISTARMTTEAELIASELAGLSFAVRQAEEEMKFAQVSSTVDRPVSEPPALG